MAGSELFVKPHVYLLALQKKSGLQVKKDPRWSMDAATSYSLYLWAGLLSFVSLSHANDVNSPVFLSFCFPSHKVAIQEIPWVTWTRILARYKFVFKGEEVQEEQYLKLPSLLAQRPGTYQKLLLEKHTTPNTAATPWFP